MGCVLRFFFSFSFFSFFYDYYSFFTLHGTRAGGGVRGSVGAYGSGFYSGQKQFLEFGQAEAVN